MFISVDITAQEQKRIVYSDVLKTLEEHACLECHNTNKKEGNVDLSNYEGIVKIELPHLSLHRRTPAGAQAIESYLHVCLTTKATEWYHVYK